MAKSFNIPFDVLCYTVRKKEESGKKYMYITNGSLSRGRFLDGTKTFVYTHKSDFANISKRRRRRKINSETASRYT